MSTRWRSSTKRHWVGFALAFVTALAMGRVYAGPRFTARSIVYYVACTGLLLLAWSVFVYGVAPLIAKRMIRRGKNLGIVDRHAIKTGGCRETTDVNETFQAWRGIDTVEADAGYIYILLHGGAGYVVPRRAFPNTAASDEFFAAARALHTAGG